MMNGEQQKRMRSGKGFIAALDQSGGSTPKALELYGISKSAYAGEEEMFDLVHQMRTRIITSPAFSSKYILGAILFEQTMDRKVEGMFTADYLWQKKGVVPFLKVDKGLAPQQNGAQLMKPMDGLDALLERAVQRHIFGTKMRSFIAQPNANGIEEVVAQQFEYARIICNAGLVPIIEPEVDIHSANREESEALLKESILKHLGSLSGDAPVMLKLSIPAVENFYADLIAHPRVLRVVALSGGYSRDEADELLAKNKGLIASFSRALTQGLTAGQSDEEFNRELTVSIEKIYRASIA